VGSGVGDWISGGELETSADGVNPGVAVVGGEVWPHVGSIDPAAPKINAAMSSDRDIMAKVKPNSRSWIQFPVVKISRS